MCCLWDLGACKQGAEPGLLLQATFWGGFPFQATWGGHPTVSWILQISSWENSGVSLTLLYRARALLTAAQAEPTCGTGEVGAEPKMGAPGLSAPGSAYWPGTGLDPGMQ